MSIVRLCLRNACEHDTLDECEAALDAAVEAARREGALEGALSAVPAMDAADTPHVATAVGMPSAGMNEAAFRRGAREALEREADLYDLSSKTQPIGPTDTRVIWTLATHGDVAAHLRREAQKYADPQQEDR